MDMRSTVWRLRRPCVLTRSKSTLTVALPFCLRYSILSSRCLQTELLQNHYLLFRYLIHVLLHVSETLAIHLNKEDRRREREIQVKPNRTILVGGQSRWTGKATRGTQVHAEVEEAGGNGGPCHCHRERPAWQVELAPAAGDDGLVLMRMVFGCRFGARSMALCCAHLVRWESMLRKTGELISRSWRARWRTALSCQLLTPRKFIIGYPQKKKKRKFI